MYTEWAFNNEAQVVEFATRQRKINLPSAHDFS